MSVTKLWGRDPKVSQLPPPQVDNLPIDGGSEVVVAVLHQLAYGAPVIGGKHLLISIKVPHSH